MRAVDKAYAVVRDGVIAGRFPPGNRITEQEVALAAGVSRTPAREALRRLHQEGVVDFTPHQGAVVTEWSRKDVAEIFESLDDRVMAGFGGGFLIQALIGATPESLGAIAQLVELVAIAIAMTLLGEVLVGRLAKGFRF